MRLPVDAERLRLIQQRLHSDFYEVPPAAERIAVSILSDLTDPEESPASRPD